MLILGRIDDQHFTVYVNRQLPITDPCELCSPAISVRMTGTATRGTRNFESLKLCIAVLLRQMCPQSKVSPSKDTRL